MDLERSPDRHFLDARWAIEGGTFCEGGRERSEHEGFVGAEFGFADWWCTAAPTLGYDVVLAKHLTAARLR